MFSKAMNIFYRQTISWMHVAGSALVLVLMGIIVIDVLGRTFFNQPLTGTPELVKVSLVSMLFLGMAQTLHSDKHIRATVIMNMTSFLIRTGMNILANACGLIVFILLSYSSWAHTLEAWRTSEFEGAGALHIPTYPLRTLIFLCSLLTSIQFILNLYRDVKHLKSLRGT